MRTVRGHGTSSQWNLFCWYNINDLKKRKHKQLVIDLLIPAYPQFKNQKLAYPAKLWNGPGWDKVGIEFTGSQLDPNFLPSLAPTNHPSVLVDISIFFYLKETLNKKLQTNCLHISLDYIPLSLHWLKWHHNS